MSEHDLPGSSESLLWAAPASESLRARAEAVAADAAAGSGVVVQDATGVIVAANDQAAAILGMSWDQLVGRTSADPRWSAVSEFGLPLTGQEHPAMVTLATGRPVAGFVMGVLLPHQAIDTHVSGAPTHWIRIDSHPIGTSVADLDGVATVFTDVTSSERGRAATERLLGAYRLLLENSTDVVWEATNEGVLVWISSAVAEIMGVPPDALIGRPFEKLVHPSDRAAIARADEQLLAGESVQVTVRLRARDESWRWMWILARPVIDSKGEVVGRVGGWRDVDREIRVQEALELSEERYRVLADLADDVVWTMAPDGRITYVSSAIERVRGLSPAEAMAQSLEQIHPPESAARSAEYFTGLLADLAEGRTPRSFRGELEYYRKDGSTFWTEVIAHPRLDADGHLVEVVGVTRDLTEHKRQEDALRQARDAAESANAALRGANAELHLLATTDALTGAWNRRHFEQEARHELARARRYGQPLSLVMIDLDRFKAVNDTFGHLVGDEVLVEVVRRMQARLRLSDRLARWGGEEFVVLLPHSDLDEALQVAEKIRSVIAEFPITDVGALTVSCGVAQAGSQESLDDWFRRVDDALYRAKDLGRDRVERAADA